MIEKIEERAIAFKLTHTYRDELTAAQLYDYTRGVWRVDRKRVQNADFAFALYKGEIKEVYEIERWIAALEATMVEREVELGEITNLSKRQAFIGKIASEGIRQKYVGKSIKHLANNRGPFKFFNI